MEDRLLHLYIDNYPPIPTLRQLGVHAPCLIVPNGHGKSGYGGQLLVGAGLTTTFVLRIPFSSKHTSSVVLQHPLPQGITTIFLIVKPPSLFTSTKHLFEQDDWKKLRSLGPP